MALYIRRKMKITYELPLQRISKAIRKVAKGDFSVDIPTTNAPDKLDYLDLMILDLNRMIKELGSIETVSYTHLDVYKRQSQNHRPLCVFADHRHRRNRRVFIQRRRIQLRAQNQDIVPVRHLHLRAHRLDDRLSGYRHLMNLFHVAIIAVQLSRLSRIL